MIGWEVNRMCSEKTPNYGLPHYLPNDHPDWLDEINAAFTTIDKELAMLASEIVNMKTNMYEKANKTSTVETKGEQ